MNAIITQGGMPGFVDSEWAQDRQRECDSNSEQYHVDKRYRSTPSAIVQVVQEQTINEDA